ncbi:MAG: glycosyltransferase family 4 protein [Brumimicrobium sp.]
MKKKIAIIVDNELDHDVRVMKEINMLTAIGYVVSVLCFGFDGKEYLRHNFDVQRISISRKKKNILFFFNLSMPFYNRLWRKEVYKFLSSKDFDVVHTHDLYMSKPVSDAIKKTGKEMPLILDLHENYPVAYSSYSWVNDGFRKYLTRPKKWFKLEEEYLKYPDALVLLSEDYKRLLKDKFEFLKKKKTLVLPNIPDLSVFSPPKKMEGSKKTTFLYFGAIGVRRGLFDVMDAFIDIQKKREDIKLLIIGPVDKSDRDIFNTKLNQINKDMVEYLPWVPLKNLNDYMSISDVGLAPFHKNPQHESGVANKIFQYMFGKLPLLVSDCKPQQDIIEENKIGLVFHDQKTLEENIEKFANEKNMRLEMSEKSYQTLVEKYSLDQYKNRLKEFYEAL